MSTILFREHNLAISKYCGPELPFSGDRRRYQITDIVTGRLITLSREQWEALGEWFGRDCSVECEGPHLDLTWDRPPDDLEGAFTAGWAAAIMEHC